VALGGAYLPELSSWLGERLGISITLAGLEVTAVAFLLAIPLLAGLLRNARALSRAVSASILPAEGEPSRAARLAAQTARLMVYLLVVAGVGTPVAAVLRPITGGFYGSIFLGLVLAAIGAYLWKRAGLLEDEFESGVDHIASVLSRHTAEEAEETLFDPSLLPGLDVVVRTVLAPSDGAVDRTLTELDLRARSGATVVAIHREENDLVLPTGRERLLAGDVLALTGTRESVEKARALLVEGPPAREK
jgi:CPA2 family monovalent cation:H+ antiporter-2